MEHENENAVEELTDTCECGCHCDGKCHCHEKHLEIFDESDIDRIIANLNDWD